MSYSGKVKPGGPAAVRELPKLVLSKLSVGPMDNNAYLLRCRASGEQLLVDAANEPDRLLALVGEDGLVGVVTTHRHGDHWQGLADVVAATGARTYAHPLDATDIPVETDVFLADGDRLRFGDIELAVVHLVGHTPGSIALVYDDPDGDSHVFTGDCLFPGGWAARCRRRTSGRCWRGCPRSCSGGSRTRRRCIRAMGTTPPSAPNGPTWPNGRLAAGNPRALGS